MAPPAARQRYNANKSDNGVVLTKKPPKKLDNNKKKETKKRYIYKFLKTNSCKLVFYFQCQWIRNRNICDYKCKNFDVTER